MQALFLIVGIPSVNKGWMKWCLRLNVQYNLWFCLLKFRTRAWMAFIKWKETCMCLCPWLCGVVVGSVGASGCLEGLGAAAGLLLDSFKTEVSHSAATTLWLLLESPHTLTARFTHSGSSGFVGEKIQMRLLSTSLNMLSPLKASFFLFLFQIALFFQLLCVLLFSAF